MFTTAPTSADGLRTALALLDDAVARAHAEDAIANMRDRELVDLLARAGAALRRVESVLVVATDAVEERSVTAVRADRLTERFGCGSVVELLQRTTAVSGRTAAGWRRAARAVHRESGLSDGSRGDAPLPEMRRALLDGAVGVDGILAVAGVLASSARRVPADDRALADAGIADVARHGDGSWSATREMRAALDGDAEGESPRDGEWAIPGLAAVDAEGIDAEAASRVTADDSETATDVVALPACADTLRVHALAWASVLDPDGAEPDERRAIRDRELFLSTPSNGLVSVRGRLLPEVAAQLQRIIDALATPRPTGPCDGGGVSFLPTRPECVCDDPDSCGCGSDAPDERRTPAQLRHDALATALFVAAASRDLPTIGGAAPTLVVTVRAEDVASGRGSAFIDDLGVRLPLAAAHHAGCAGGVQRVVVSPLGRITRVTSEARVFDHHQRRAIAARDGGCIIPGCHVPAAWCEIHHVTEHATGGATTTDNGVLLCWFHHRFEAATGWAIRMNRGVPEVRAPGWFDARARWRPVTRSRTRLAAVVDHRRRSAVRSGWPPG